MRHFTHPSFWKDYQAPPPEIRDLADRNFALLKENTQHPSLHFERVGRFWSARVGIHYRAIAVEAPDGIVWFRIVPHDQYDRIMRS